MATPNPTSSSVRSRGFTLIELSVVIIIIALLAAILLVAVRGAILKSRVAGEKQVCVSLRMACEQFKQQFGFLPPLVYDADPLISAGDPRERNQPNLEPPGDVLNLIEEAKKATPNFNAFYSVNAMPIYLVGVSTAAVDGVEGPGFTSPQDTSADNEPGHFSRKGKTYEPLFDVTQDRKRLSANTTNPAAPQYAIIDRWGRALRYYRWQPSFYDATNAPDPSLKGTIRKNGNTPLYNVPTVVFNSLRGDATARTIDEFPELRSGGFAIVSAGPDGKFSDDPNATADNDKDNIVEVGR